jgi:HEAT repeat protein
MVGAVLGLFQTPYSGFRDAVGGDSESSSSTLVAAVAPPVPSRALSPELVDEVATYVGSYDILREESGKRLREGAARLTASRKISALSELIQLLAESAESDSPEEEAIELAREFTTPGAASYIVALLGAAEDEGERARLTQVISRLGREGALALADALGESRDRSERRAFLDALVSQGPLAREMANRMVGDPRWFVVRNGVTVLGELGGDDAVAHLTGTLANGDSRVRKETILSLTKIGGADAEMLVLGMLEDGDPEVRAGACKALGVLRSHRAYRPLLQILDDDAETVQVEALQALGRIGDPGAVQAIEKKAVGGLFSRPPREVRIAAFQALGNIGTARALKFLEKGAKDGDPGVKAAAKALLEDV